MLPFRHFLSTLLICSLLLSIANCDGSSIYEVLKINGLPMGLLPKGVNNFSLDNSGKFQVHLDRACNAKFENEIHYDMNVSGTLRYGQIDELSGISAQDLFLWFPVIEIRVDVPSSGLIYFNVGVVSKQFSLSSFETPRDCLAVPGPDHENGRHIVETVSKIYEESAPEVVFLCSNKCAIVVPESTPLHDSISMNSSGRFGELVENIQNSFGILEREERESERGSCWSFHSRKISECYGCYFEEKVRFEAILAK